jgi:hypothetical protein
MNRLRALLVAACLVGSSLVLAGSASAGPLFRMTPIVPASAEFSCVTTEVIVYENGYLGGDNMYKCVNASNLGNYTTGLHNGCNARFGTNPNWNDCISSLALWLPTQCEFEIFVSANYGNQFWSARGPINGSAWTFTSLSNNDIASSFKFQPLVLGGCG